MAVQGDARPRVLSTGLIDVVGLGDLPGLIPPVEPREDLQRFVRHGFGPIIGRKTIPRARLDSGDYEVVKRLRYDRLKRSVRIRSGMRQDGGNEAGRLIRPADAPGPPCPVQSRLLRIAINRILSRLYTTVQKFQIGD